MRNEYVIYHITQSGKPHNEKEKEEEEEKSVSILTTLRIIWVHLTGIFINYVCTFTVFPGVTFLKPYIVLGWWYLYVVSFFGVLDTLGRFLPSWLEAFKNCKQFTIVLGIFRIVLAGIFFIIAWSDNNSFANSIGFKVVILFLFSITNGYVTTSHMMYAPSIVEGKNKDIAGQAMALFLSTGIAVGSVFAGTWVPKVIPS